MNSNSNSSSGSRKRKSLINESNNNFNTRFRNFTTALNTNAKKVGKFRAVAKNLPPLMRGTGMMCTKAGYTRYLNEIQKFFEDKRFMGRRINTVVYKYMGGTDYGLLINRPSQLINNTGKFTTTKNKPIQMINNNPTGIYYFMVFAMNNPTDNMGHAISILVDPNRGAPRLWVFDPHGASSMNNSATSFGRVTREKIVPNIKKMFGDVFNTNTVRTTYYNGPNLQARNNRGVCTTFYVSFAEQVMNLLNNTISLDQMGFILPNSTNARKQFLNNPPNPNRNVVERQPTVVNKPLGANRIFTTMGTNKKRNVRRIPKFRRVIKK